MIQDYRPSRLRFEQFELDTRTGELRKNGEKIRLQDQPTKLLTLLATHPGELITRVDIQQALWADGEFVEYEHAINTAIKKVREALEDDPAKPRLIETLPRKGYRFLARVEDMEEDTPEVVRQETTPAKQSFTLPLPSRTSRALFVFIQAGYLAIYCTALYYIDRLEAPLTAAGLTPIWLSWNFIVITAMCGIAVRLYLLSAVGWAHPEAGAKFRLLFPVLLILDAFWAASPLLTVRVIGIGVALAGVAGLAYLPFAQRTLIRSIYPPQN
jgi:cholera toxin transcriptional activator